MYRPVDPERFNGTVVLHWNNVTAGYDLFSGDTPEILEAATPSPASPRSGSASTACRPRRRACRRGTPSGTATLSIASDDDSFDIFTQAARAVGPDRDRTTDPLGGLDVERVIAMGSSQSAGRLATYVNAIHPLARAIDGFLLLIYFGSGTPLAVGDEVVNIVNPTQPFDARAALRGRNRLRDDLDVPVMVVNSELEAIACYPVRQPDTDRFRYWEAAGTCHVSQQAMDLRAPKYERDFGTPLPMPANVNHIPMTPLYDAALHHLHQWLTDGRGAARGSRASSSPATRPRSCATSTASPAAASASRRPRCRSPTNSAIPVADDIFSILYGSSVPFPADKVRALYGDLATYLARFEEAARAAEKAGVLLPRDVHGARRRGSRRVPRRGPLDERPHHRGLAADTRLPLPVFAGASTDRESRGVRGCSQRRLQDALIRLIALRGVRCRSALAIAAPERHQVASGREWGIVALCSVPEQPLGASLRRTRPAALAHASPYNGWAVVRVGHAARRDDAAS